MASATVNQFHLSAVVSGIEIGGLMHAHITSTNAFAADRYSLTFAMGSYPLYGIDFWSALPSAYIELSASSDTDPEQALLVTGMADSLVINPLVGTVSIEGRDLSASLVDTYRQKDFVNQTASEIVAAIAADHGLIGAVTPTTGNVGRFYADNHTRLSVGQFSRLRSDWDLVAQLARENGFDAFVQGTFLFFQPAAAILDVSNIISPGDVSAMRWERVLALANSPSVRVQSWNSQNAAAYVIGPSPPALAVGAVTDGTGPSYLFSGSNLTPQQASASAKQYTDEIARFSNILQFDMPWVLSLTPRTVILVQGVGPAIDGTYRIESIDRTYSSRSGSVQHVRSALIAPTAVSSIINGI